MAYLKLLSTVIVPKSAVIMAAGINAFNELRITGDLYVTSGSDKKHMVGSKHYSNEAIDFRTKNMTTEQKIRFKGNILGRLGKGYQAILEYVGEPEEHLHVEYDPN